VTLLCFEKKNTEYLMTFVDEIELQNVVRHAKKINTRHVPMGDCLKEKHIVRKSTKQIMIKISSFISLNCI
jgi:hypothetical protein